VDGPKKIALKGERAQARALPDGIAKKLASLALRVAIFLPQYAAGALIASAALKECL
jgi:hypothetical protein